MLGIFHTFFLSVPDSVVQEPGGVWAVSFTCAITRETQTPPWFTIGDVIHVEREDLSFLKSRHLMYIQLKNSDTSSASQDISTFPGIDVDPPNDVAYEPGQDFNVTGSLAHPHSEDPVWYLYSSFSGINLQTGKLGVNFDEEELLQKHDLNNNPNKSEELVTFKTSTNTISGYFIFGAAIRSAEGDLVEHLQLSRVISVRPSNQSGDMPPGYLGFFDNSYVPRSENGNQLKRCTAGYECWVSCTAVGETISVLEVKELLPDGSKSDVPSSVISTQALQMDTFRIIYWKFRAEDNSGDADGITTYECKASDESQGKAVTKLMDVMATIPGSIDHDRSNVETERDQMDPYLINVTFNCAINGRPLPDVMFYGGTNDVFSAMYFTPPDSVIPTGPSEAMASKVMTLDLRYVNPDDFNDFVGQDPYCEFYSPLDGRNYNHTFEMPHIDLFSK
ncbi:hypothetical protein PoB_007450500 [Plakobranchus ocellatus]|uniref:Uncharacterized protein n=1 Tax=Plakobranchus ocellatus TaxID=259542 RepID=A0AAV4DVC0_9GAST|nr:hypothetical protein PoB_007450500 [Plakobranchus ocellatus]